VFSSRIIKLNQGGGVCALISPLGKSTVVLFNGSIRDNMHMVFLRNTSETEVIEAAKAAKGLGILSRT